MITLVIYGVIAIALAASAGYAFLTFSNSSRQLTQLQENQVRMETATAALRASLLALSNDGVVYAPSGSYIAGQPYTYLPSSLGVVGAAPWGQPYLYCPVSQTGASNARLGAGAGDNVVSPSGAAYLAGYIQNGVTQNNKYVITSSQPNNIDAANAPGYVAFIVSTLGPGQTMPDCSQIVVTAGGLSAPGATVRGVTGGFSYLQRVNASSDRMEIYVGNAATNDKTGRDINNLTTMDNAMAMWAALQPRLGMIYLENTVTTTSTLNALDASGMDIQAQNASLVIETDPTIVNGTGPVTLTLQSALTLPAATSFQNLNITGPGSIIAYKPLKFRNVAFTAPASGSLISVYGTDLTISDSNFSNTSIYGANSRISFLNYGTNQTGFNGSIVGNASSIDFESATPGGTANFSLVPTNAGVVTITGGNATIGSTNVNGFSPVGGATTVSTNGQFSINGGNLYINGNSQLTMPAGSSVSPLVVANGSVSISGSLTANSTDRAIYSYGSGVYIAGALNANNGVAGAILAEASTISGSSTGSIKTYSAANPCIGFYSTGGLYVPLYITQPATGYASFLQAQLGYPPLLTYATSLTDTGIAAALTQNAALGTDPYIPQGTDAAGIVAPNYLDKTSFEAGVRSIVNQEAAPGLNIYFPNTFNGCHT